MNRSPEVRRREGEDVGVERHWGRVARARESERESEREREREREIERGLTPGIALL
jgi:hypothetical protein